jgi:hypothetical protein
VYSTCLHCNAKLGANEVIEPFPVGRRLAFDAAKGRLWVVCPKCHRWNLSPLEERWEAIEECERQFRGTRLRASTDNIGLAKLGEGLELLRVGKPVRPEMAAWRYAREFRRRWKTRGLPIIGGVMGLSVINGFTGIAPGLAVVAATGVLGGGYLFVRRAGRVRGLTPDGRAASLRPASGALATLLPAMNGGWAIRYSRDGVDDELRGPSATRLVRGLLTCMNFSGGPTDQVRAAQMLLEGAGSAEAFIRRLAAASRPAGAGDLSHYAWDIRLALEMALHEETERRALEGELAPLAQEWALAEQVAEIADNLLLPPEVLVRFALLKTRTEG